MYRKYKSDVKFNTSLILSEVAAPFGAAAGAYITNNLILNDYLSSIGGGIAGHYLSAITSFGASWYLFNREEYKNKIRTFAKEYAEIILKNIVPGAISYVLYSPIAAGFTSMGSGPPHAAFYAVILSALIFIGGSNIINQGVIGKYRN